MRLTKMRHQDQIKVRYKGAFAIIKGPVACFAAIVVIGLVALAVFKSMLSIEN